MTLRKTYLEEVEVKAFIDWFIGLLKNDCGEPFVHSYKIEGRGRSTLKKAWQCNSFYDAYSKYNWQYSFNDLLIGGKSTGSSYLESKKVLNGFESKLMESVECNDNDMCYKICYMILDWGGVLGGDGKGNKKRINELRPKLCLYLKNVKSVFDSSDVKLARQYHVSVNGQSLPITMNAGFTKIYSLLCDNFVIYDGRVGAALGLLVRSFYIEKNPQEDISKSLLFYFGKAKNAKVNRNPSEGRYVFKALSQSMPVHIRNNLKANWIIQSIIEGDCGEFSQEDDPARCIEAALFMIGYKV